MKICPACSRDYADDSLNFCLMCGAALADGNSQPTVAMGGEETLVRPAGPTDQTAAPTQVISRSHKRGIKVVWILLAVFATGVALIFAGIWVAALFKSGSQGTANTSRPETPARSPRKSANSPTPRPSPTADASPLAAGDETPTDTPDHAEISEPTPIVWATAAMTFNGEPGQVFTFECPSDGTAGAVYGSDVYSTGSSICTAAVHAGTITLERGGTVTIEYRPGRKLYGATTRNGITSTTYGEFVGSFVIKD